ncbi:MAG: peptidase M42, partial [Clostridia bacterium]|nr:peptidase M42 [Clostridia bacterium]
MKYNYDPMYTIDTFRRLVNVPSIVGYYVQMNPVIEEMAKELGYSVTYDHKSTPYITVDGIDNSKTILVGAHLDTIGMVVRRIDKDGMIRVRQVGGVNYNSLEGETVTIYTRDGRAYTGLMACQSHSVHVFDDART